MTFETRVDVRFNDLDTYGHVNNAVYATYLEEARIAYLDAVIGRKDDLLSTDSDGVGMVVADLRLEYERPIETTDSVTVAVEITAVGRSSFTIEYEIREEAVVATAETTMVAYDRGGGKPQPIPDRWRESIAEFEGIDAAAN